MEEKAMSILSKINDFFRIRPLTADQQLMLEQLQTNRAKAVYVVPEPLWKEFLKSVYSDALLRNIAIQAFSRAASVGIYRSEYMKGHLNTCLGVRGFGTRLAAKGVDPQRVVEVMLENIV
jgi:hypothetical protein